MSKIHVNPGEVWVDLDDIDLSTLMDSFSEMMIENPEFDSMCYSNENDIHYFDFQPETPYVHEIIKKTLNDYLRYLYGL